MTIEVREFNHSLTLQTDPDGSWGECDCGRRWQSATRGEICDQWLAHARYLMWKRGLDERELPAMPDVRL